MGKMMRKKEDPLHWYKFLVIAAIELLLAFSSFGYIIIKPLAITMMPIPVIIGAFFLGPLEGMALGGIFGLTSMWKASISGVSYVDSIFSPFNSGAPFSSVILSVGTRMAFGFLAGIIFKSVEWSKYKKLAVSVAAFLSDMVHSFLVYTALYFLFPELGFSPLNTFEDMIKLNSIVNRLGTILIILAIYIISTNKKVKEFKRQIEVIEISEKKEKSGRILIVFAGVVTALVMSLGYHFFTRIKILLLEGGIVLDSHLLGEFVHIGLQFFISSISLIFLIMVVLIFIRKYSNEMELKSELDIMTGIYNKGTVISHIKEKLKKSEVDSSGFFIILDIDYFKIINDKYGHLFGDTVLIKVAEILMNSFRKKGIVGRFGGDEFCILTYEPFSVEYLEDKINKLRHQINKIEIPDKEARNITCSIGISHWQGNEKTFEELYHEADTALYTVKNKGRDGYAFWEE